jgi:large subunit ribosomal protein L30
MPDKTTRTIRIKWVRSGIGFPRRQKTWVQSLGLRELNQVVERPDTPQIRGLVARAHHLVEIVGEAAARASDSRPEYTVLPREIAPEQPAVKVEEPAEQVGVEVEPAPSITAEEERGDEKAETVEVPAVSGSSENTKRTGKAAKAKEARPAKDAARKVKKPVKETARKESKARKAKKK